MVDTPKIVNKLPKPIKINELLQRFLRDESISGKLIVIAALLSLIVVNSPLINAYENFWHTELSVGIGSWDLALDLRHWVNEALMAFFFLVVGLEIKRELVRGELKKPGAAVLPIGAAIGGMIVPALIYLLFNLDTEFVQGWGIPIATDIAFAVGILSLLGNRVPLSLKVFLLTLAIVDDIGAITIIALFYSEIISVGYLLLSAAILAAILGLRHQFERRLWIFMCAGIALWVAVHLSGIHASIVGAILGLIAPIQGKAITLPVAERLEKIFLPFSTFIVLPLFVFANAGFVLSLSALTDPSTASLKWGILIGLVVGKVAGVLLGVWLLTRLRWANLPSGVNMRQVAGIGFLAGIGFTVSIFITELAFAGSEQLIDSAKMSIFMASAISALLGTVLLNRRVS